MVYRARLNGVYQIRHLKSSKRYIGSCAHQRGLGRRWRIHQSDLRRGRHHNSKLQRAWKKYGEDAFIFEILLYCDAENCLMYEQMMLDHYQPEYNDCKSANSPRGRIVTCKTRNKIRQALLGKPLSDDRKRKISRSKTGQRYTCGEKNGNAKLTSQNVLIIRQRLRMGNKGTDIAKDYNCTRSTISSIKLGKTWRNV